MIWCFYKGWVLYTAIKKEQTTETLLTQLNEKIDNLIEVIKENWQNGDNKV